MASAAPLRDTRTAMASATAASHPASSSQERLASRSRAPTMSSFVTTARRPARHRADRPVGNVEPSRVCGGLEAMLPAGATWPWDGARDENDPATSRGRGRASARDEQAPRACSEPPPARRALPAPQGSQAAERRRRSRPPRARRSTRPGSAPVPRRRGGLLRIDRDDEPARHDGPLKTSGQAHAL